MTKLQINLGELAFQAEGGDKSAQYRLGVLFLLGESVEQDPDAACRWLEKAGQYNGAHLLVEQLVRYQAARMPEKQPGGLASIGDLWRSAAAAFGRAGNFIGLTSNVLAQKVLALNPKERVAKVRFEGGAGDSNFGTIRTADSRFPETP